MRNNIQLPAGADSRIRAAVAVLAAGIFAAPPALAAASPVPSPVNEECLVCHSDPALTGDGGGRGTIVGSAARDEAARPLFVDAVTLAGSVHARLDCTSCHAGPRADSVPHTGPIAPVDCTVCHSSPAGSDPLHNPSAAVGCKDCHGTHGIARGAHTSFAGGLFSLGIGAIGIGSLLGGVLWRLRSLRVLELVRKAPGWRSGQPLARLLRLALLQSRIARRPRGWSHVAIFIGVTGLTFALLLDATDRNLLRPAGLRFLDGAVRSGFAAAVDMLGILLIAGCATALVRQITRRDDPERSVQVSHAAILSALLLLGGGGFLLEGIQVSLHPFAWTGSSFVGSWVAGVLRPILNTSVCQTLHTALWWSHVVIVAALVATLPATSLFHAVAAPLNMLIASEHPRPDLPAPFDLRELIERNEFDVKVGARCVSDLDDSHRLALLACTSCGRCDDVCPSHQTGAALSPRRLVSTLRDRMHGDLAGADLLEGILPDSELWACTSCAACVEACPVLVGPLNLLIPFRRELVSRQRLDQRQAGMLASLQRCSNPYGLPHAQRAALPRRLGLPSPADAPDSEWLYWIGCAGSYDERIGKVVESTVTILRAAGISVSALGAEETCTGDAARRLGEEGLFQQIALANIETFQRYGIRRILTHCAHCFNTLKHEYPRFGGRYEVVHHSELIAQLLREGRIPAIAANTADADGVQAVTFHDSCYAGRYNGLYSQPREALAAIPGVRSVEMPRNREGSFCCGGGGAAFWYDVPARETPGAMRVREAAATGADTIGVACPFCLKMLDGATAAAGTDIDVMDISEIVAAAMARADRTSPASGPSLSSLLPEAAEGAGR